MPFLVPDRLVCSLSCANVVIFLVQPLVFYFCVNFLTQLNQILLFLGSILSFRGYLASPWEPFVLPLWPRTLQSPIFDLFWGAPGGHFGRLLGSVFASGPALAALGKDFGAIFTLVGCLSLLAFIF